jgi:hypothetical protein
MGNLENAEKRADGIGWKTVEIRSKKPLSSYSPRYRDGMHRVI